MNEIFYAHNIDYPNDKGHGLVHLSLSVKTGEMLGIYGNRYAGKNKLFSVMEGKIKPTGGKVYWKDKEGCQDTKIYRIGNTPLLLKEMSVWENLAILCWSNGKKGILTPQKYYKMTEIVLNDYDLKIRPEQKIKELSSMEILYLEILAARLQRTELLLIDNEGEEARAEEYEFLKGFLMRLQKEGMSICFFSYQISVLYFLCDRIAVLSDGKIIKVLNKADWAEHELEEVISSLYARRHITVPEQREQARKFFEVRNLKLKNETSLSFSLYSGEYVVLISPQVETFSYLKKYGSKRAAFLETQNIDSLIERLSPLENLCLGFYDRFSFLGFEKRKVIECLEKEFDEWYGRPGILRERDCRKLYRKDRIAINLFRIRMQHPKVLICNDLNIRNDITTYQMLKENLVALTENGTAVCIVTNEIDYSDETATRFIVNEDMRH